MSTEGIIQIVVFLVVLTLLTPLVGGYMARVYSNERVFLSRVLSPVENLCYRIIGVSVKNEQGWKAYGLSVLTFSFVGWLLLYGVLMSQSVHPLNPQQFGAVPWDLGLNASTSFLTNTNWQYYGGETTLSYLSQMAGLAVQNFLSAAVGIAVLVALVRGFARRETDRIGNFWQDLVRGTLYILLPLSFIGALFFVSQGVIQSFSHYESFSTLSGVKQTLAYGPVASQESIKLLGTNGGGFFNVNSAMPFENPNGLTNFIQMLMILIIPAGLTSTFGRMVGNRRQGWALFVTMMTMFVVSVGTVYSAETHSTAAQHLAGLHGPNFEGKEQRFGIANSALFAAVTTVTSCGAVNTSFDSLTGLGGAIPMANIMSGEAIFGGVGVGLYSMLLFALLAVFLAGLMVGRTPEYLGKKIEAREIKLVVIATLAVPLIVLITTAVAISSKYGAPSIFNGGPQGFSETLYAYLSQGNNNGSAFAGYTGFIQPNAPGNSGAFGVTFANVVGSLTMLIGRFAPMLAVLALAGSLATKRSVPPGPGSMRTDTPTFVLLLIATIVLIALLTFVPALLLGPGIQALSDQLF